MTSSATDVFISYKAEDRGRLKPLVEALEAEGFSVWWDTHIGGGSNWRRDIEEHLDAAKCVVVAWTKRSVGPEGEFVRDEAGQARRLRTYLPVLFDMVELPLGFREVQAISLKGWKGDRSDPRFLMLVDTVRERITGEPAAQRSAHPRKSGISRRSLIGACIGIGGVAVAGGGWLLLRPAPANSKRIAVLPFANLSGDPAQAYFSDGIAEELRSSLSRVGMQVIGRTSSDAVRSMDAKTAATKLGVANILTGSVRRSAETIRVEAQLVGGSDGVEHWAQSYDRAPGDTIKIQTDIAENVAQALSVALGQTGRRMLSLGGTTIPAAQDLFLRVNDSDDSEAGLERKLAFLDAAISLDPKYAEAYAVKAFWLVIKAGYFGRNAAASRRDHDDALASANRAIAIAPTMALGYAMRAIVYKRRLQIGLSTADARHALTLPGQDVRVLNTYAASLAIIGDSRGALLWTAKVIALDPFDPGEYAAKAQYLYNGRHYSEAVGSAHRSLALGPDQVTIRAFLGDALLFEGKHSEAEAEYRKLDSTDSGRLVGEAALAARTGKSSVALDKLRTLKSIYGDANHYQYSQIYAQLERPEDAFKELELAWQVRNPNLFRLRVDPFLDPIRSDPRYAVMLRRLNFP